MQAGAGEAVRAKHGYAGGRGVPILTLSRLALGPRLLCRAPPSPPTQSRADSWGKPVWVLGDLRVLVCLKRQERRDGSLGSLGMPLKGRGGGIAPALGTVVWGCGWGESQAIKKRYIGQSICTPEGLTGRGCGRVGKDPLGGQRMLGFSRGGLVLSHRSLLCPLPTTSTFEPSTWDLYRQLSSWKQREPAHSHLSC